MASKQTERNYAVRNSKDTLFKHLFSEPKPLTELYHGLTGNKLSPEDIQHVNLDDKLTRQERHNDTAFITNDNRLMVFIEHQSTHNENMPHRMLEYYVGISKMYDIPVRNKMYGQKAVDYPRVEFFVAYNGVEKLTAEDKILFTDLGDIKIQAKVVDICYDALPEDYIRRTINGHTNRLIGYARFVWWLEYNKGRFRTMFEEFMDAVEQCKREGHLLDILNNKELINMLAKEYSYDEQIKHDALEKGIGIGEARGIAKGKIEGKIEGIEEGIGMGIIKIYFTELNLSVQQIAEKLMISEKEVDDIFIQLNLIPAN